MKLLKQEWDVFWAWLLAYPIKWLNLRLSRNPESWIGNNAANVITVIRGILMTPLATGLALADPAQRGPWLFAIFCLQLTDGADGAIARGTGKTSDLGSALDGGVDKYSALLLLSGLVAWIRPEFGPTATVVYAWLLAMIIGAEVLCIRANKDRMWLYEQMNWKFSSRFPAQLKFLVSMLILGSCWLTSDRQVAALIFIVGIPIILGLTIWSMLDYMRDRDETAWEYNCP